MDWVAQRRPKSEFQISSSAIGWYGGDEALTEQADYHDEYTHQLCDAWEK